MTTYQAGGIATLSGLVPVSINPDNALAIIRMEADDAIVILEKKGDEHVVKVRVPGKRQIRTGSTSGYPIQGAFEKWRAEITHKGSQMFLGRFDTEYEAAEAYDRARISFGLPPINTLSELDM